MLKKDHTNGVKDDVNKSRTVLVVEDDEGLSRLIKKSLDKTGFDVGVVHNGVQAVDWIVNNPVDLMLLDYKLPDMSAGKIVEALKERKIEIPFIIMTGHGDESIAVEMMKSGAKDYIAKEGEFFELLPSVIKWVFEELQRERELVQANKALEESEKKYRSFVDNELVEQAKRMQALAELSMNLSGDPMDIFKRLAETIGEILDISVVCLSEILGDECHFLSVYKNGEVTTNAGSCPINTTPCSTVKETKEMRIYHNVIEEFPRASFLRMHNAFTYCGFPSLDSDGNVISILCLLNDTLREFSDADKDLLQIFVQRIGLEMERKKHLTERKKAEATISKLSLAVEQSPNTIVITDINANIEYVNPKFTKTTGYTSEEAIGQNIRILKSGKTSPAVYKKLWETIKSGNEWRGEFINRKKNGELYSETAYIAPIKNTEGVNTHFVAVKEDITESKKIEEELINTQKLESIGVLAGGIAHDFNNSLQAIYSCITVAKLYVDSEDEVYKRLTNAEKITLQAKSLSQQLLTFSNGGAPIRKTIFISKLIKDFVQFALSGSNVRCEFEVPDSLWSVKADKGQLNQVISNICINANQSMTFGGTIKVKAENYNLEAKGSLPLQEGKYVKITIKDQGTGIPPEYLQKIFDPYFTTKEEGSGLGLTTTYSIIKKHDGYISVESEVGIGTTFHIYLPASKIEIQQESILDKAKVECAEEASTMCKGKILLMDDEGIIRLAVAQHLRNLKYEVETAREGVEAIELYKEAIESDKPFDAVVMDLTIPGDMGGKEATKRLLEIDPKTKVIVASGYVNDPIMAEFEKHGFKGVLTKPYEIDELDEVLQKVIMEKES